MVEKGSTKVYGHENQNESPHARVNGYEDQKE